MKRFAVLSESAPNGAASELERRGITAIALPPHPLLAPPVDTHADMIFRILDGRIFFDKIYCNKYPDTVSKIVRSGGFSLAFTEESPSGEYPNDVKFNLLVGGDFAVGKKSALSKELLSAVADSGRDFIDVRQGYAACSCLLAKDVLVTADKGIASALSGRVKSLVISPRGVALPPYEEGFIGGACGFDGDTVYFAGSLSRHPDGEKIKAFLAAAGVGTADLFDGELSDVGGIIFI